MEATSVKQLAEEFRVEGVEDLPGKTPREVMLALMKDRAAPPEDAVRQVIEKIKAARA